MHRYIAVCLLLCSISVGTFLDAAERFSRAKEIVFRNKVSGRNTKGLDETTKAILSRFAAIVMGFFSILQDPNNTKNVVVNITTMLTGAVSLVAEAIKKGNIEFAIVTR